MNIRILYFGFSLFVLVAYSQLLGYWVLIEGVEYALIEKFQSVYGLFISLPEDVVHTLKPSHTFVITEESIVVVLMYLCSVLVLLPNVLYRLNFVRFGGFRRNASVVACSIGVSLVLVFQTTKLYF